MIDRVLEVIIFGLVGKIVYDEIWWQLNKKKVYEQNRLETEEFFVNHICDHCKRTWAR